MNRRLIPLIAAAALTLSLAGAVSAVENETWRPTCADIVEGSGQTFFDTTTNTYHVTIGLTTAGRCGGVTYTLYVYDELADCLAETSLLTALSTRGTNANGQLAIAGDTGETDEGNVFVYVTSSLGNMTLDRAPDTGCNDLSTASGAGGKFN